MRPDDAPGEGQPRAEPEAAPAVESADALFAGLADGRRRRLLEYMSERSGPVGLDDVALHHSARERGTAADGESAEAAEEVAVSLCHVHLPKLREGGVIAVDREAGTIEAGDRFEAATSLLEGG